MIVSDQKCVTVQLICVCVCVSGGEDAEGRGAAAGAAGAADHTLKSDSTGPPTVPQHSTLVVLLCSGLYLQGRRKTIRHLLVCVNLLTPLNSSRV